MNEDSQIKYLTGYSPQVHQEALQKARAANDTGAIKTITEDLNRELDYQKTTGNLGKEDDAKKIKDELASSSQTLLDVLQAGKSGKLKGQAYKDQLDAAASRVTAAKGFSEGGKALTAPELTTLGGQIPTIQQEGANFIQKAMGIIPPQRGHVVDDEATLRRKAETILAIAQGKKIDPEKVYQGGDGGPSLGGLVGNAGGDIKGVLNGILNLPRAAIQAEVDAQGNPIQATGNLLGPMLKGVVSEYNQAAGEPLKGGDIAGRIGKHAYDHPVNTLLDILPFIPALKGLRGAEAAGEAGQVGKTAEAVSAVGKTADVMSPAQKGITSVADLLNGGGSKEFIARGVGKDNFIPQNKVLLDEGILAKPTETGRIQATSQAIQKTGSELGDLYKTSDRHLTGEQMGNLLNNGLKEAGYDTKAISFIKKYLADQGEFDITKNDSVITMEKAWKSAQTLEKNPPKMLKNPESSVAYKQLAKDSARIIRQELGKKVPETLPLNAKYSALQDYFDNKLPTTTNGPGSGSGGRGIVRTVGRAAKGAANPLLNVLYKGISR